MTWHSTTNETLFAPARLSASLSVNKSEFVMPENKFVCHVNVNNLTFLVELGQMQIKGASVAMRCISSKSDY